MELRLRNRLALLITAAVLLPLSAIADPLPVEAVVDHVNAQAGCQRFGETDHTLCGRFLQYWQQNGGLAQQGYPISEPFSEMSGTDGKIYTVQYFERAVFELHPENQQPNDVLLSLLGTFRYKQEYPNGAAKQVPTALPGSQLFPQTGKRLGGTFLSYWQTHGGLAQQGYPISDEFLETSATDGKIYKVQYFERAVFKAHPENQPPNDVLLSLLGTFRLREKYGDGSTLPSPAVFESGGLGISKAAWEAIYGHTTRPGEVHGGPWPGSFGYTVGADEYSVIYSADQPDGLIIGVDITLNQPVSVGELRTADMKLLPSDVQTVTLNQILHFENGDSIRDTYLSPSLSAIYPPGTPSVFIDVTDLWYGAAPGTITILYDLADSTNPDTAKELFIFAGGYR